MEYSCSYETGFGNVSITANDRAITGVFFGDCGKSDRTKLTDEAAIQLREYFEGKRKVFALPLELRGTDFQKRVWNALLKIPYGETRCYAQIAQMAGSPKGARAAGMGCNRNPIGIIVPCHRVVGKDGNLTGYEGGLEIKARLLELEKKHVL